MSPLPGGFANISGRSSIEITFEISESRSKTPEATIAAALP